MSDKTDRLLKIYSLLKRGPVTIETVKQWAEKNNIRISERTFYRDLNDLENSLMMDDEKLVVIVGEKNKKIWKIEFADSNNELNEYDINSYLLFKKFLPLPIVLSRRQSLEKIENLFYTDYSKSKFEDYMTVAEQQIVSSHFFEVDKVISYEKIMDDAIWSIQNKREIQILEMGFDYTSVASSVKYPLNLLPLQLIYHRGVVHIAGLLKNDNKLLILALEQFKKYKLTNNMFNSAPLLKTLETEMQKRFGITENMNEIVYEIEIEFSRLTGSYIKNQSWHSTQTFENLPNGNLILKMECGINRELVGWIFQWMTNAKVLKPVILKTMVQQKLQETLNSYHEDQELVSNNSFRAH